MVILQAEEQGCHDSVRMKLPQILTIVLHNKSYHLKYSNFDLQRHVTSRQRSLCHLCMYKQLYSANRCVPIGKAGHYQTVSFPHLTGCPLIIYLKEKIYASGLNQDIFCF